MAEPDFRVRKAFSSASLSVLMAGGQLLAPQRGNVRPAPEPHFAPLLMGLGDELAELLAFFRWHRPLAAPPGFLAAWHQLVAPKLVPEVGKRPGRKARVPLRDLLAAQVFHVMNAAGTLAEHLGMLFDDALVDSSCSDRRTRLPWRVFTELMQRALRPLVCRCCA